MSNNAETPLRQEIGYGKRPLELLSDLSPTITSPALRHEVVGAGKPPISPAATTTTDAESTPGGCGETRLASFEDIVPEIVVRTDNMDIVDHSTPSSSLSSAPESVSTPNQNLNPTALMPRLDGKAEGAETSLGSSLSVVSDQSELSSLPSALTSKATTPIDTDSTKELLGSNNNINDNHTPCRNPNPPRSVPPQPTPPPPPTAPAVKPRKAPRRKYDVRPKISVPPDLQPQQYAMQCIAAAESSRLNPYALHQEEYLMLRHHISHAQVTTYLNIRNGILRLWVRNPQIAVTRDEAVGCAKDARWFDVASVCFDWLVRKGYMNFGCVETTPFETPSDNGRPAPPKGRRKKVVVIGAGMSGLGCARQLEGLFAQYSPRFWDLDQEIPEIVVLEGRNRIGGRIYSHPFKSKPPAASPSPPASSPSGRRFTAEMGGMIITGFDRGNPLNILVRGQLGLPYHALRSETTIYDPSGKPVDPVRDQLVEKLFNDCLDRVSEYKFKHPPSKFIEGNRDLIDEGRDSLAEVHKTIAYVEETTAAQPHAPPVSQLNIAPRVNLVPVSSDRVTGRILVEPGTPGSLKASHKAKLMGWPLKHGGDAGEDIDLHMPTGEPGSTLGSVMDNIIAQYKDIVDLNPQDFRLINWHIANLEYSNAINYRHLSLQGWDIDAGNEWEGKHTMVVGGYQSVPRGLAHCPTPLNLRQRSPVSRIRYDPEGSGSATVECEDGFTIEADYVVNTIPLGVLKHGSVEFDPPLPPWKTDVISRLGFGVLNKVVLAYKDAFWDGNRDIFGVLRNPPNRHSLNQKDYSSRRGRFFQWFNVSNTSGLPALLALMAGDAGFDTEQTCNDDLIAEATEVLRSVYGSIVPEPVEAMVTRWGSDKFARGSYSSAGPDMRADDYDVMARPVGNLFFAGEHTVGTHPATVHGAYLSGLRVASEVLDAMLGPIEVPTPLILPRELASSSSSSFYSSSSSSLSLKRKAPEESKDPSQVRLEAYEIALWDAVVAEIGLRPLRPAKPAMNAYLYYSKANFERARRRCEEGRRPGKGRPSANEVRVMSARMWKESGAEERRPFEALAEEGKSAHALAVREFGERAAEWDAKALELRAKYEREHPNVPGPEELAASDAEQQRQQQQRGERRSKNVGSYAESETSDVDMAT